jgi:hypothetical protein
MKTCACFTIVAAAAALALGLPAAAQQQAPSRYEKKEFTHTAWTRGIFSEAGTVKGVVNGKFIFLARSAPRTRTAREAMSATTAISSPNANTPLTKSNAW